MTIRKPLFVADWMNAVFMHFRLDATILQPSVPLALDTFDGDAYVSLVAFTQNRLRPNIGGRFAAMLSRPLSRHPFFNLRTYVRHGQARGIFFIAEWIPNRLAALIGPRTYGLPYRLGRLDYRHDAGREHLTGRIEAASVAVDYRCVPLSRDFDDVPDGSLDRFLLERYTAFTHRKGVTRRFDVDHQPWAQTPVNVELLDRSLFDSFDWMRSGELLPRGHYSPGVFDVGISAPRVVAPAAVHSRFACSMSSRRKT